MKSINPVENFKAVTPHDTDVLKNAANGNITTRGIIVGAAGIVSCRCVNENTDVSIYCAAGVIIPIVTDRINSTNTTATGIVACW